MKQLYGLELWIRGPGIDAAFRRSAFRVIFAFHTVSADAVVLIAGMILLRLVVDIERRKHDTRS